VSAPTLQPASPAQRPLVERLWQLYTHDLSQFRGSMPAADGLFRPGRLPLYFEDPDRTVHLIAAADGPAGFAMVRRLDDDTRVLGEFFVVRAARRRGIGRAAALELLRAHPGTWEIAFQEENPGAARFWRKVAHEAGPHREERRPVPGKPELPPDTWLLLTVEPATHGQEDL
jgi:predicted acetyltransferase